MDTPRPPSSYLDYLPAIFRQEPFVGQFLLAFETVLSGTGGQALRPHHREQQPEDLPPGLETTISGIADYFDPAVTKPEFLPWLAGWVNLSLRADWDEKTRRSFIQKIVPLYKLRGTLAGLRQMLNLYTAQPVQIYDAFDDRPYFFEVQLILSVADPLLLRAKQQIARAIIDQEKPAHTYYALQIAVPTMRLVSVPLNKREGDKRAPLLILGKNTVLGTQIPSIPSP